MGVLPTCSAKPKSFDGGAGTIMSYCDQLEEEGASEKAGGGTTVSLTFGAGPYGVHPCGNQPQRMVQVMRSHVADRAAFYPMCFSKPGAPRAGTFAKPIDITGALGVHAVGRSKLWGPVGARAGAWGCGACLPRRLKGAA